MLLSFSDDRYRIRAMELAEGNAGYGKAHTAEEAFRLLIHDAAPGQLSNLCKALQRQYPACSEEECYAMTQQPAADDVELLPLALQVLDAGLPLGEATDASGRFNLSHYMGHSVLEGKLCRALALACGLDGDFACCLGLLHDYGRREVHSLAHTTRGFELLLDAGWEREAVGCLTHSFLRGGRCASNESAEEGFYVNHDGEPCWAEDAIRDDITVFLEHYRYTDYDLILNIADLMATSTAIVSPEERLADIATRRTIDPTNRGYFLCLLLETLQEFRTRIAGETIPEGKALRAAEGVSMDEIHGALNRESDAFFALVQSLPGMVEETKNTKTLLRLAGGEDASGILALYRAQLGREFCPWDEHYPSEETIADDLAYDALFVLTDHDGKLLGTISIDRDPLTDALECWNPALAPAAELCRLAVAIDHQNQGIARQMILDIMDILRERGYRSVHYLVNRHNRKAIRSYAPLGFDEVGSCELYDQPFLCFEKALS